MAATRPGGLLLALAVTTGALQPAHRSARPARRTLVNAEDPDKPMTLYDLPAEGEPWLNRYSSMLTRNKKQGARKRCCMPVDARRHVEAPGRRR